MIAPCHGYMYAIMFIICAQRCSGAGTRRTIEIEVE